jgi:hypothetical protein
VSASRLGGVPKEPGPGLVQADLEYNFVRWADRELPPQVGLGVYERGPDGLLAAARVYDDVEPPPDGRP